MPSPKPQPEPPVPWSRLAGMGFEFGASLAVCTLLGWWVDRHWGSGRHWGLLIGILVGLIGGTYNFVREALQAVRQANRSRPTGRDDRPAPDKPDDPADGGRNET